MKRVLGLLGVVRWVVACATLAFVAVPAASALATTIGQSGGDTACLPQGGSVIGDTNYVVPSGGGVITSFSFQSTSVNAGNQIDFLVLRPAGTSNYTVVGKTGVKTLAGTGLETFFPPSNIAVQGGDILGFWNISPPGGISFQNCLRAADSGGGAIGSDLNTADPNTGDIVSLPVSASGEDVNESANLLVLPTSKAQCKHGGWKSFGTLFKNQGDCVSFVATGGKNSPGGVGSKPSGQYTVCQSGCPYDGLQDAILAVENGTIPNPITVGPGDYRHTSASVSGTVVIRGVGDGSDGTILDGFGSGSVVALEKPGNLTVSGVEITNGKNDETGGGGIFNDGGTVIFDGPVSITSNAASDGGGIFNDRGTVTFAAGSNVSITGNTATLDGGGIFNHLGTVTFDGGSTVSITGNTPDNCVGTTSCP